MDSVFPILEEQMHRKKIKRHELAKLLGCCNKSLFNKLRGITPFTWDEVSLIRNTYFPDISSDELFARKK